MAIAGDIIIKLAADFAEFSKNMVDSAKAVETFGERALAVNQKIEGFLGQLNLLARATGAAFVIDKVVAYTDNVQKMAVEVAKLADKFNLSAREVQALQVYAEKTGQPLEKLAEYAKNHRDWLENATLQAEQLGQVIDSSVVRNMKRMNDEAAEAQRRLDVMFATGVTAGKSWVVEALDRMVGDLQALQANSGIIDTIAGILRMLTFGGSAGSAQDFRLGEYQAAVRSAEEAMAAHERLVAQAEQQSAARGYGGGVQDNGERARLQKAADDARVALAQYRDAQARAGYGGTLPAVPVIADKPAGGGGRTDDENIEAQIKRYEALAEVAKRTGQTISDSREKNIEDLQREVRVQEQVEEVAAKLGAKYADADDALKKRLHDEIDLYEKRKDANQQALQNAQKAEEMEVKFGDGVRAREQLERDLTRAKETGRVTTEALTRAEAQRSEQLQHTALQARRYDDNLGSLAAGFQDAALSYQRSTDLFATGGAVFSGVTTALGDGLDVLVGKSTKTFNQIASDFAMMLAKMALQAAISPVFKMLTNALSGWLGGMSSAGQPGSPFFGPVAPTATARAGGGDVYGGQPYWVGEYGPERFVPQAAGRIEPGGGGGDVFVSIANYTDSSVSAKKSKGPGGQNQVDIIVEAVEGRMSARLSRGQGSLGRTIEGKYGLQQVGR